MFSSQEELGTRGAKIGAYSKNIDEFISVDVSLHIHLIATRRIAELLEMAQ